MFCFLRRIASAKPSAEDFILRLRLEHRQQILNLKNPCCQPRLHRRGNAKRLMDSAPVVAGEENRGVGDMILNLLTVCIGEPRIAADAHSYGQVSAFDEAR